MILLQPPPLDWTTVSTFSGRDTRLTSQLAIHNQFDLSGLSCFRAPSPSNLVSPLTFVKSSQSRFPCFCHPCHPLITPLCPSRSFIRKKVILSRSKQNLITLGFFSSNSEMVLRFLFFFLCHFPSREQRFGSNQVDDLLHNYCVTPPPPSIGVSSVLTHKRFWLQVEIIHLVFVPRLFPSIIPFNKIVLTNEGGFDGTVRDFQ